MWFTYIAVLSALALLRHIWVRYLKPLRSFNGKHVLITGGSMGIGLDMAKSLAKMGAKVTIWARKLNQLEIAAREIGGNVNFESVDVSDFQSVSKGMDNAIKVHGDVDYLICNAGATAPGYIEELDVGVFDWLMKINYMGSVNTVKAALPHMIQRKSVIVDYLEF
jgi:NADP-dependent 3-hydroxy acid dehydrogenase YdfG